MYITIHSVGGILTKCSSSDVQLHVQIIVYIYVHTLYAVDNRLFENDLVCFF